MCGCWWISFFDSRDKNRQRDERAVNVDGIILTNYIFMGGSTLDRSIKILLRFLNKNERGNESLKLYHISPLKSNIIYICRPIEPFARNQIRYISRKSRLLPAYPIVIRNIGGEGWSGSRDTRERETRIFVVRGRQSKPFYRVFQRIIYRDHDR